MCSTSVSRRCTWLLSPPQSSSPHVTTEPSSFRAAKALKVLATCTTLDRSNSCTALQSPPASGSPHVTTAPPSFSAANAVFVWYKSLTPSANKSRTAPLSPPASIEPHVTTEPSALRAAYAASVPTRRKTPPLSASRTTVLSPPAWGSPHVTTQPSSLSAAKALVPGYISCTCVRCSWTALLSLPVASRGMIKSCAGIAHGSSITEPDESLSASPRPGTLRVSLRGLGSTQWPASIVTNSVKELTFANSMSVLASSVSSRGVPSSPSSLTTMSRIFRCTRSSPWNASASSRALSSATVVRLCTSIGPHSTSPLMRMTVIATTFVDSVSHASRTS
mmetsp:Transcript_93707/g.264490  ORF Transcript_93707/g.264490 Transcript_93707/m.264490 type:complete len:334 (-) Transcript_93707:1903-2904(-)